jgi:hypothetical protein
MTMKDRLAATIAEGYMQSVDPGGRELLIGYHGDFDRAFQAAPQETTKHYYTAAALLMERFIIQDKQ